MELESAKMEAFAQALARGLPPRRAASAAGYARDNRGRAKERAARADVIGRVAEIEQQLAADASDLGPLIDEFTRLAGVAAALGTAAGLREARAMLAEVVKLKTATASELDDRRRRAEDEAWVKTYGPAS